LIIKNVIALYLVFWLPIFLYGNSTSTPILKFQKYHTLASESFQNDTIYNFDIQTRSTEESLTLLVDNYVTDAFRVEVLEDGTLIKELDFPNFDDLVHISWMNSPTKQYSVNIHIKNTPPYNLPILLTTTKDNFISNGWKTLFFGIYSGMLILFLVYALISFLLLKRNIYIFYSIYIITTLLFFACENGLIPAHPLITFYNNEPFIFVVITLSYMAAILFNRELMEISVNDSIWDIFDKVLLGAGSIIILLTVIPTLRHNPFLYKLLYHTMLTSIILTFGSLVLRALKYKPKKNIVWWLLVLGYVALFVGIILKPFTYWAMMDYSFIARYGSLMGQITEVVCLSSVLLLRNYWDGEERLSIKLELEASKRKALQSQMNPHFIFNALGAIQGILESSNSKYITLKQELDILKLYVGLEEMRFEGKFDCIFDIDENIDWEMNMPPMIFQPYLENAINHGIYNLNDRRGKLIIRLQQLSEYALKVVIEDNGVGRERATKLRTKRHKSRGMQIVKDRVDTINNSNDIHVKLDVIDIISNNQVCGTQVTAIITEQE